MQENEQKSSLYFVLIHAAYFFEFFDNSFRDMFYFFLNDSLCDTCLGQI